VRRLCRVGRPSGRSRTTSLSSPSPQAACCSETPRTSSPRTLDWRIDYTLDRLRRAGYIQAVRALGTHGSSDPLYEIMDDYLAYWFARVFAAGARAHAQRLVTTGALPDDTITGRWWLDETVEIDVLGLSGDHPVLVGEARWQTRPLSSRDLTELRRRAAHLPPPGPAGLIFAFWSRGGVDDTLLAHPDVRAFTADDLVTH